MEILPINYFMFSNCDRIIKLVEAKIEKHKVDFRRSPEYIVTTKEYYDCLVWHQAKIEPGSNVFISQFQGITIVLISGEQILEVAGSAKDMVFQQVEQKAKKS
jgi:hypothetical protein